MPLRRLPMVNPATLNSLSHRLDVSKEKWVFKYFDVVYWVDNRLCLKSLSAKDNSLFCTGDEKAWSIFNKCLAGIYFIENSCASSPPWMGGVCVFIDSWPFRKPSKCIWALEIEMVGFCGFSVASESLWSLHNRHQR